MPITNGSLMQFYDELDRLRIPLEDIKRATKDFDEENLVGRGSLGNLYKGKLLWPDGDNVTCVFKRLNPMSDLGSLDFFEEIKILSKHRHENIISLVGFCNKGVEQILVYPFVTHGSLDKHLSSAKLTWLKRIQICLGAAQGLNYLHNPQEPQKLLFHLDIKSMNILLDENWNAKIADIRLPRFGPLVITNVMGTMGYTDPLYKETGRLTKESDIYSFGVVLFKVLCGRLAVTSDNDITGLLSELARRHYEKGTLKKIIDPVLSKQMNQVSFNIYSSIAYRCLQWDRKKRPTILEVVKKLGEAARLQYEFEKTLRVEQLKKEIDSLRIPLEDINGATNNFDEENIHGRSNFGNVYKGELLWSESTVTCLFNRFDQLLDTEFFYEEIRVLSECKNENIVSLVGFDDNGGEQILVYHFVTHGSLNKYLSSSKLMLLKRIQICLGVARGLNYLHNGHPTKQGIIHHDLTSLNILLDENWDANITHICLGIHAYADPLYVEVGLLTKKSNIYSFGVMLFEVLCGRQVVTRDNGIQEFHTEVVSHHCENGTLSDLIDPILCKKMSPVSLDIFSTIAYQCLQREPEKRPTILEILKKLEEALRLQHEFEKALPIQQEGAVSKK